MLYLRQADSRQVGDLQPASPGRRQAPEGSRRAGNQKILLPQNDDNTRRNNRRVPKVSAGNREETERVSIGPALWRARTLTREKRYRGQKTSYFPSKNYWQPVSTLERGSRLLIWRSISSVSVPTDSSF